ncbi:MAG TPA: hypothetical protein VGF94_03405 [Kofleriaceae bacterium]
MRVLACLVLAACGRVDFAARFDARADGAPPPCTWSAFAAPQKLPAVVQSPVDDWYPTPTVGGTQLFFYSYRGTGFATIWHAPTDPYDVAVEESELDSGTDLKFPTLTDDGLDLIYGGKPPLWQIFETTRAAISDMFAPAAQIPELASTNNDFAPWVSADGLRLVFSSDRGGTGSISAFETARATRTSAFAAPVELGELGLLSPDNAIFPGATLSPDALDIWVTKLEVDGHYHIFTAHRAAIDQPFAAAVPVPELTSLTDDGGQRLSADGSTMFLNYDSVAGGGTNADLWSATRTCD